jgi:predicted nucleic acid-binding protein
VPPLIVLDTGVVIRALIGSTGASSYRMVRLAATGTVRLAHSDEGLRELTRVVEEKDEEGFIRSASKAFGIAMDLWAHGTLYHPTRRDWPSLDDPDDGCLISRSTPRPITSYLGIHTLLILRCRSPSKY